jgi:hypothetical protein
VAVLLPMAGLLSYFGLFMACFSLALRGQLPNGRAAAAGLLGASGGNNRHPFNYRLHPHLRQAACGDLLFCPFLFVFFLISSGLAVYFRRFFVCAVALCLFHQPAADIFHPLIF